MARKNTNPAGGDGGARQVDSKDWSATNSQIPVAGQVIIEHRYTRDHRAPLCEGDDDLDQGWQSIPLPPSLDDGWEIFDTRKDYKTGWRRIRIGGVP
jgi:hypothetical protein